jgi:hypothetical protein
MVCVTDKTHEIVTERALAFSKKEFGEIAKIPSWASEDESHFFFLSLDKYDRQNLSHYEWHLRKDMVIDYKFTPYTNGKPGVNMMLNSMWKWSGPSLFDQLEPPREAYKRLDSDSDSDDDDEIDEIADAAAARATSTDTELNAEEKEIDDEVEARVAERFNLPATTSELLRGAQLLERAGYDGIAARMRNNAEAQIRAAYVPMAPPKLERQNGITGAGGRRRRAPPSE